MCSVRCGCWGRSSDKCRVATEEEEYRLRLVTPAVNAFVADRASGVMEECMAALGGQGYMEENGFGT